MLQESCNFKFLEKKNTNRKWWNPTAVWAKVNVHNVHSGVFFKCVIKFGRNGGQNVFFFQVVSVIFCNLKNFYGI